MQDDAASLFDILDSARLVQEYVKSKTCEEFVDDVGLQDKVVRRFQIIGEAARRLSEETRNRLASVPWRLIVGLRNLLIHNYGEVNYERLWEIVQNDLPRLIEEIEPLVPPPPGEGPRRGC